MLVTHSPDLAPDLPADAPLLPASRTHFGQIVPPERDTVRPVSCFGGRYRCGPIREGTHLVVVTADLGTSSVRFRLGAPPDLRLLPLGRAAMRLSRSPS